MSSLLRLATLISVQMLFLRHNRVAPVVEARPMKPEL
jgi:hypothetical protein